MEANAEKSCRETERSTFFFFFDIVADQRTARQKKSDYTAIYRIMRHRTHTHDSMWRGSQPPKIQDKYNDNAVKIIFCTIALYTFNTFPMEYYSFIVFTRWMDIVHVLKQAHVSTVANHLYYNLAVKRVL